MSAGYFLYDWIFCTLFSGNGILENLHHLATLVGLLAGIVYALLPSHSFPPQIPDFRCHQIQPQRRRAVRLSPHGRVVQPLHARALHLPQPCRGHPQALSLRVSSDALELIDLINNRKLTVVNVLRRNNEVLFALFYFIGRILFGTWLVYVAENLQTLPVLKEVKYCDTLMQLPDALIRNVAAACESGCVRCDVGRCCCRADVRVVHPSCAGLWIVLVVWFKTIAVGVSKVRTPSLITPQRLTPPSEAEEKQGQIRLMHQRFQPSSSALTPLCPTNTCKLFASRRERLSNTRNRMMLFTHDELFIYSPPPRRLRHPS